MPLLINFENHIIQDMPFQKKSWYYFVLETYRNRFEELLTLIDQVTFRNMVERLSFYLQRHADINQTNTINLSHQQIADELNSSREVISRLLKKMVQRGLLKLYRNFLELKNTIFTK